MGRIVGTIEIRAPIERVYEFCTDVANLPPLFPREVSVEIVHRPTPPLSAGSEIRLLFHRAGINYPWESVITECRPPEVFEDVQVRGPMKRWVSRHFFEPTERGTRVRHVIEYEMHFGMLGRICAFAAEPLLRRIFRHVHHATRDALEREQQGLHGAL